MKIISCTYLGDGQTSLKHGESQIEITTDFPMEFGGKSRCFSTVDLFVSALASSLLSTIGVIAESRGKKIDGIHGEVEKIMKTNPKQLTGITIKVFFPKFVTKMNRKQYIIEAIQNCPLLLCVRDNLEVSISSN